MNEYNKQINFANYIKYNKFDVIFIQEHNIRDKNLICKELLDICHVFINLSINQKGGTAIFINRYLPCIYKLKY